MTTRIPCSLSPFHQITRFVILQFFKCPFYSLHSYNPFIPRCRDLVLESTDRPTNDCAAPTYACMVILQLAMTVLRFVILQFFKCLFYSLHSYNPFMPRCRDLVLESTDRPMTVRLLRMRVWFYARFTFGGYTMTVLR